MSETIQTKTCPKCKQTKCVAEFHKQCSHSDGLRSWCKDCVNAANRIYSKTQTSKDVHRRAVLKYTKTEKYKEYYRKYGQSEKGKEIQRRYYRKNPERRKANAAVNNAIIAGKFPRPTSFKCNQCGQQARIYHHWQGYSPEHWFDVVPLCYSCHKKIHQKTKIWPAPPPPPAASTSS